MPSRSRPATSMRVACRRAKASPTRASAPAGSGWARRVPTAPSCGVGGRGGQEMGEGAQGGLVGPVQILQHHHQRTSSGGLEHPPDDAVPARERGLGRRSPVRAPAELAQRLQHRPPRPQRRRAVVLRAAADRDGEAAPTRPGPPGPRRGGSCRCRAPPRPGPRRSDPRPPCRATRRGRPARRPGRRVRRAPARRAAAAPPRVPARPRRPAPPGSARSRATAGAPPTPASAAAGRGRCRAPRPGWSAPCAAPPARRPAARPGPGPARAWPTAPRAAGASPWPTRWSPARRRGRRRRAVPAAGPPRPRPGAARARPLGLHVGMVGQVGVRLPRPRRQRRIEPVDRGDHGLAASASLDLAPPRTATPAGRAPGRSPVPPRRTRARRRRRPAPAGRSRGRWSR